MLKLYAFPYTNDQIELEYGYLPDRCRIKIIQADTIDGLICLVKKILLYIADKYDLIGLMSKNKFILLNSFI